MVLKSRAEHRRVGTLAAWIVATLLGLVLAWTRFKGALGSTQPDFEAIFLPAAQAVASGGSPYSVAGYYYTPLVALFLAPWASSPFAAGVWAIAQVLAGVAGCVLAVQACARQHPSWLQAMITSLAFVTMFYSWPLTFDLWLGLPEMFVVLALAISAFASMTRRPFATGVGLGLSAMVKTWPAGFALWLVRRPLRPRWREWVGIGTCAAISLCLALAVGGWSAVVAMIGSPFTASNQPLAAYSVWGAPKLLFSTTTVATPLLVSPPLQVAATALLVAWVAALLVLVLRRPGHRVLALYNLAFVIILLLPVSHYVYLMFPLPALWWWVSHALRRPRGLRAWIVVGVLSLWWLISFRVAPAGDGFASTTWESLLVIFSTTLLAATASAVAAGWPPHRHHGPPRERATAP